MRSGLKWLRIRLSDGFMNTAMDVLNKEIQADRRKTESRKEGRIKKERERTKKHGN
jgi:hypothetical protein